MRCWCDEIVDAILRDQQASLTVCTAAAQVLDAYDVTVSLPHLVSGEGVLACLPLPLSQEEHAVLRASPQVICNAMAELDRGASG